MAPLSSGLKFVKSKFKLRHDLRSVSEINPHVMSSPFFDSWSDICPMSRPLLSLFSSCIPSVSVSLRLCLLYILIYNGASMQHTDLCNV
jgi:hypothetical protein